MEREESKGKEGMGGNHGRVRIGMTEAPSSWVESEASRRSAPSKT